MQGTAFIGALLLAISAFASTVIALEASPVYKFVYVVPSDVVFDPKAYESVQEGARLLAEWYKTQFNGNAPDYKVDYVFGKHTWRWYVYNADEWERVIGIPPGSKTYIALENTYQEVISQMTGPADDPNLRLYMYLHEYAPWDETQGTGIEVPGWSFASYEDIELVQNKSVRGYLGLAHESGHMWGLPHQGPDDDCMMFGFYNDHCDYSQENRNQILAKYGKFFNGQTGKNLGVRPAPASCAAKVGDPCGNSNGATCCPPEAYCMAWDPWYYQCIARPPACPDQVVNVDYFGNDMKTVYVNHPSLCCDECNKTPGCRAYTFVNYPGTPACYLKSAAGAAVKTIGAVSGVVVSRIHGPSTICTAPLNAPCGSSNIDNDCCNAGFCQPINGVYQCKPRPQQCNTQLPNTDYFGNDLADRAVASAGECCDECAKTLGCVAYTYVPSQSRCYLKTAAGNPVYSANAISGLITPP